jgi:Cytochrome c554 and c-prime
MLFKKIFFIPVLFLLLIDISNVHSYSKTCASYFLRTDSGEIINPISGKNSDKPYSTKQTCGPCHDYEKISKGYHFNMDWDKADDNRFKNTDTPWLVSTGLTGSMTTIGYYQLAKKQNNSSDDIDLTSFAFASRSFITKQGFIKPSCAGCHAGGGLFEHDRNGLRYDEHLKANPELANSFDGDYYQSKWDKSGVIEVDCFFCHSNRYNLSTRISQIKDLNFKWAGIAAAGIGQIYGKVTDNQVPKIVYNKRLFNEDGSFVMPSMIGKPGAKNCLLCHATIDTGKRGTSWGDRLNPDTHHLAGLTCIDCHFGDINHNLAKGNTLANNVRNDLDNTMRSCEECHTTGYKGATLMKHKTIRKDHLEKLSCQACHIPQLNRSAIGAMYLNIGRFNKHGQINAKKYGQGEPWKPAYIKRKTGYKNTEKIFPVNPIYSVLFTNKNKSGQYYPLFLSEVEKAYKLCKNNLSKRDKEYDFHNIEDVKLMLTTLESALSSNKRFKQITPCFHNAGNLYSLDKNSDIVKEQDNTWVKKIPFFSISHNVAPLSKSLGKNGCKDCHSNESHMFNGPVVVDYFGDNGKPSFTTTGSLLGIDESALKVNLFFHLYLSKILPFISICLLITIAFFGFRFFYLKQSNLSGGQNQSEFIFTFFLIVVFATIIVTAHLLIYGNTAIITSLGDKLMGYTGFFDIFLIIISAVLFVYFVQKYKTNKTISWILNINATFLLITGLILYNKNVFPIKIIFTIMILHGIFAVIFAGMLTWFIYLKLLPTPNSEGLSSVKKAINS